MKSDSEECSLLKLNRLITQAAPRAERERKETHARFVADIATAITRTPLKHDRRHKIRNITPAKSSSKTG